VIISARDAGFAHGLEIQLGSSHGSDAAIDPGDVADARMVL
jgi:hypothetical protein